VSRRATLAALLLALAAALLPTPADASNGYELTGFGVDGEGLWQAQNSFTVHWDPNPPGAEMVVITVRDSGGGAIPDYGPIFTPYPSYGGVRVPPTPGIYLIEGVTLGTGRIGPSVYATMRFDDAPPPPVGVEAPAWVAAGSDVPVRIDPPTGPAPLSGIVGYATSLDHYADGVPCVLLDRCGAEVDLAKGIGDDRLTLTSPPEGVGYVHVAAVSGSGVAGPVATAPIGVDGTPPAVALEGLPAGWAAGPVRLTAVASDPLSGMAAVGPGGPITAISIDGGPAQVALGGSVARTVAGEGVHQISSYARDAVGNSGDGSRPGSHPATATVRIDETDPSVRFAASDPSDPERIEATVADGLSGPDPTRGRIEIRAAGVGAFRPLPTAVSRGRLVARWDSDDFPHGAYEFRAIGYDAAGNATTSTLGAGGAPFVLTDPVKREARLAFGFGGSQLVIQRCARADGSRRCHRAVVRPFAARPAARTMPCCHGTLVGGRLLDAGGAPLAGQTVEVVERLARGATAGVRRTPLVTDAQGRFQARLAPGPSREVSAEFPGTPRLTRAAGREVRLRVRAAIRMRVSDARAQVGGAPVVFSGRIVHPDARIPARGLPVELEFRLPGLPWAQFRTVETDARGHFAFPYEFSDDDSVGVRFQFRAFLPASGGWPFAPATSRPLAVTG
jgi:hypothetical protein